MEVDHTQTKPTIPHDARPQNVRTNNVSTQPPISTKSRVPTNMVPREPCSPNTSQTKDLAGFIRNGHPAQNRHSHDSQLSTANPNTLTESSQRRTVTPQPMNSSGRTHHARSYSDTVPRSVQRVTMSTGSSDSAYASGSDQKAEKRVTEVPNQNSRPIPSRSQSKLALFPSPDPSSPNPEIRTSPGGPTTPPRTPRMSSYTTTPRSGFSPERIKSPPSSFSLRKMFNRKSKDQALAV